jgi:hypothetical protein
MERHAHPEWVCFCDLDRLPQAAPKKMQHSPDEFGFVWSSIANNHAPATPTAPRRTPLHYCSISRLSALDKMLRVITQW